jgi:hypothetical protein
MTHTLRAQRILFTILSLLLSLSLLNACQGGTFSTTNQQQSLQNVEVSQSKYAAYGEPYLAVNPANPHNLLGASQDINASSWPTPGTFASFDSGMTWQDNGALPLPKGEKGGGDVTVAFSSQGIGYVASNAGASWQVNSVLVWQTENGGKSFSQPVEVSQNRNQQVDHPWMAIDTTHGPHAGTLYVVWAADDPHTYPLHSSLLFSRSTDSGRTFETPRTIAHATNMFPALVVLNVGADGSVNVFYTLVDGTRSPFEPPYPSFARQFISSSDGGITFATPHTVSQSPLFLSVGHMTMANIQAAAADPSGDHLYLTLAAYRAGTSHTDILLWSSQNHGQTWTGPVRVNNDPMASPVDCFQPQIVVTQQGIVYISYFKLVHGRVDVFLEKSTTHGASFQSIRQVNTASFDPALGDQHREKGGWIGDYQGLAAWNEKVYPFWNDTRTGHMGIFTVAIQGVGF